MVGCTAETGLLRSLTVVTTGGVHLHITLLLEFEVSDRIKKTKYTPKKMSHNNTPVVCMVGFNFDSTN